MNQIDQPDLKEGNKPASLDRISTLYLDEHVRVIHKPANLTFHSDNYQQGLVSQVRELYSEDTLFPVHRLDRVTSGLMIFARNRKSNSSLSNQFESGQVEKYYLALTNRKPPKKQGSIIGDMQKGRRGSYLLLRSKIKPAITRFIARPITQISAEKTRKLWLFVLKPDTGKTHQLRVAMKSMSCAILGDLRYGKERADRTYLHAYKLGFELFGKHYELADELLCGEHFDLELNAKQTQWFEDPKLLKWPNTSFRLITRVLDDEK